MNKWECIYGVVILNDMMMLVVKFCDLCEKRIIIMILGELMIRNICFTWWGFCGEYECVDGLRNGFGWNWIGKKKVF